MQTNNLAIQTSTYGANERVEATTSTTSVSSTLPQKRIVLSHAPYISRRYRKPVKVPVPKRQTGHEKESRATGRAIKESWRGVGGTQDVPLVEVPKPTPLFFRRRREEPEIVLAIFKNLRTRDTNESVPSAPSNIENLFTLEDFIGVQSPAEDQAAHAIHPPQQMLAQDSQQPAGTSVPYGNNGDESFAGHDSSTTHSVSNQSVPRTPTNIEDLFTWQDFLASVSPAGCQDPHTDPPPQQMLAQNTQQPAGTSVPYGDNGAVSFAGHDSPTIVDGNYLTVNLSTSGLAQPADISFIRPCQRDPHYFSDVGLPFSDSTPSPSSGQGARWYEQHWALGPSFLGIETAVGQGAEWMGAMRGGASSSNGQPRGGKGRKRAWSEMGDADEGSSAGPAKQKLRSDRTLGATVPRGPAFMTGQQWGLEPFNTNQAIGMGDQCDGEGRPLNPAHIFSLDHREG